MIALPEMAAIFTASCPNIYDIEYLDVKKWQGGSEIIMEISWITIAFLFKCLFVTVEG